MSDVKLICGNTLDRLRELPDESVQCIITSPPYWGLRAYGTDPQIWLNGKEPCAVHTWEKHRQPPKGGKNLPDNMPNTGNNSQQQKDENSPRFGVESDTCAVCGAWRGELGLEPTPELYTAHLVQIFREARRVLRDDGVCFLNLGDSYVSGKSRYSSSAQTISGKDRNEPTQGRKPDLYYHETLKDKDLCGIPWRVAFALQADGWYLRQDIIWAKGISGNIRKGSAMPESVRDRFQKSHEYVFLLSKSARYYFDLDAVADVLDKSKSHEYNTDTEDFESEDVQQMQSGKVGRVFQQEQSAIGRTDGDVQGVSVTRAQEVGLEVQRDGKGKRECATVLLLREGAEDEKGVQGVLCLDRGTGGEVSNSGADARKGRKIQGASAQIRLEREGKDTQGGEGQEIFSNGQGKIQQAQDLSQAQVSSQVVGLHSEKIGVGRNQEPIQPSVRVLQQERGAPGDRPHYPAIEGRGSHGDECCSSVQDVQREERKQTATRRSVWQINPRPFREAHFAVFPPALIEPMVLAGTSERGCCPQCGKAWERETIAHQTGEILADGSIKKTKASRRAAAGGSEIKSESSVFKTGMWNERETIGWRATCECNAGEPVPCTVLDPFNGAGTTGVVALKHGRRYIGIELKPEYVEMSHKRLDATIAERERAQSRERAQLALTADC